MLFKEETSCRSRAFVKSIPLLVGEEEAAAAADDAAKAPAGENGAAAATAAAAAGLGSGSVFISPLFWKEVCRRRSCLSSVLR